MSSPEVIEKLSPNNYKVDAYYIPEEDGSIKDVFIYQDGKQMTRVVYGAVQVLLMWNRLRKISEF